MDAQTVIFCMTMALFGACCSVWLMKQGINAVLAAMQWVDREISAAEEKPEADRPPMGHQE